MPFRPSTPTGARVALGEGRSGGCDPGGQLRPPAPADTTGAISGAVARGAYADAIIADSPIGYWRLGESSGSTVTDETGTYGGTYYNSPTLGATGALSGDANTAATFAAASTQYAQGGGIPLGYNHVSVEMWVKFSGDQTSYLWESFNGGYNAGTNIRYGFANSGWMTFNACGYNLDAAAPGIRTDGLWHHIVLTADRSGYLRGYIDGSEVGTAVSISAASGTNFPASDEWDIARRNNATPYPFDGSVDEVAVYASVLSPTQVAAHYAAGTAAADTSVPAEVAATTVTAQAAAASVAAAAGSASVTPAAQPATPNVGPSAGVASAPTTANAAAASVAPTAGVGAITIAANAATVTTSAAASAPAGVAATSITATAAAAAVAPSAGTTAATVSANAAAADVRPAAGAATASVAAGASAAKVAPTAGVGAITIAANAATVTTSAMTNAPAGVATVSVTASPATAGVAPGAPVASATVGANAATVTTTAATNAPAGTAAVTLTANAAGARVAPNAGAPALSATANAAATRTQPSAAAAAIAIGANAATVVVGGDVYAIAGVASIGVAANQAGVAVPSAVDESSLYTGWSRPRPTVSALAQAAHIAVAAHGARLTVNDDELVLLLSLGRIYP